MKTTIKSYGREYELHLSSDMKKITVSNYLHRSFTIDSHGVNAQSLYLYVDKNFRSRRALAKKIREFVELKKSEVSK